MFTHAITRMPGINFAEGLTTANLGRPSYELILRQHQAYRQALLSVGLDVVVLPAEPAYPMLILLKTRPSSLPKSR